MFEPLVRAVVAAEDRRFYEHGGVDPRRIASALWTNLRRGRVAQGASTITQQYARNAFLDRSRTWGRKVREAWLAHRLEQHYGKPAILQAYLNQVYFGEGYYGVEAASLGYFGKHAADLTAVEGATLASVINRPSGWALRHNPSNVDGHHRRSQRRLVRRVHASPRCGRVGGLRRPSGVVHIRRCRVSGGLANEYCERAGEVDDDYVAFGREPDACPLHTLSEMPPNATTDGLTTKTFDKDLHRH